MNRVDSYPDEATAHTGRRITATAGPFVLYLLIVLTFYPRYRFLNGPDAISYISVARHYIHGEWREALNPYWSPLFSWLMIPLIGSGIPGLASAKIVSICSGFLVIWSIGRLLRISEISGVLFSAALYTAATMTASFSLIWITPDLLSAAVVLWYLTMILSPSYGTDRHAGLRCGLVGALGYLAKAYNFYFFLGHFTLLSLLRWIQSDAERRRRALRHSGLGLAVFVAACAPWIAVVSTQVHSPAISSASEWNRRLVGPNSPGFPQFYRPLPPSSPHALSMWENPSPSLLPQWSLINPPRNLRHELRLIVTNLRGLFAILNHVSVFGLAVLFGLLLWGITRTPGGDILWLQILLTVALLPAGYLFVTLRDRYGWNDRYLWVAIFLLLLIAFIDLRVMSRGLSRVSVYLAIAGVSLSFSVPPMLDLLRGRNGGRALYEASVALKSSIPAGTRLASCGQWNDGLGLAYFLNTPYYGVTGITADEVEFRSILNPNPYPNGVPQRFTPEEMAQVLRANSIDYLVIFPDCPATPSSGVGAKRVETSDSTNLAVYKLDH